MDSPLNIARRAVPLRHLRYLLIFGPIISNLVNRLIAMSTSDSVHMIDYPEWDVFTNHDHVTTVSSILANRLR